MSSEAPFGHRGAAHSFVAAASIGLVCALLAWHGGLPSRRTGLLAAAVVASHGVLDAFTDGGLGIALLWPFSDARWFAPWQPLPVAPIGRAFLSARGLAVATTEIAYFTPLLAWALWPRRRGPSRRERHTARAG
jgi:inner membrane protein